ncbi:hypothetical protein [Mycolicibacterium aubagnense]|uniref:hypothetical protein n=1 Tax=Mycolicibacterium aubagnense TaxID=319707 RepID=UPI0013D0F356|nr:hypothetical protein [Mycolicibacterium aubagnense]
MRGMSHFGRRFRRSARPMPASRRAVPDPLPRLALPPTHQSVQSLDVFDHDGPLDSIPLGVGVDGVVSWSLERSNGLLVNGGTGGGTTQFMRAVTEQCRTRGWQVLIADGFGFEFMGFRGTANVSYVSDLLIDMAVKYRDYLTTLELAHSIMTSRREVLSHPDQAERFAPLLLVLGELAGPMPRWEYELDQKQIRRIHKMIEDLLAADQKLRCHVLISVGSGWRRRVPKSWATWCDTVIFDYRPERASVAHYADPSSALEAVKAAATHRYPPKGRGVIVSTRGSTVGASQFQAFLTYSPAEKDLQRHSSEVAEGWKEFKLAVSDAAPALHPPL